MQFQMISIAAVKHSTDRSYGHHSVASSQVLYHPLTFIRYYTCILSTIVRWEAYMGHLSN